jgi:Ca2+-transporting ATPase
MERTYIAQMIQSQDSSTPLQIRLAAFGKRLSIVILIICTLIFMIGWLNGEAILSMLLTSIACCGRHSGLPALVTIALAFGAKRLAKVMHLYENFRGGNTWLLIFALIKQDADRE